MTGGYFFNGIIAGFLALGIVTGIFFSFSSEIKKGLGLVASLLMIAFIVLYFFAGNHWEMEAKWRGRWLGKIKRHIDNFVVGLEAMKRAEIIAPAGLFSLISWMLRWLIIWLMFPAFHLRLHPLVALVSLIMVNLGSAVVNSPANISSFELSLVAALSIFSVDKETALSLALTLHLAEVGPVFLLGLLFVWLHGLRIKNLRLEDIPQPEENSLASEPFFSENLKEEKSFLKREKGRRIK